MYIFILLNHLHDKLNYLLYTLCTNKYLLYIVTINCSKLIVKEVRVITVCCINVEHVCMLQVKLLELIV